MYLTDRLYILNPVVFIKSKNSNGYLIYGVSQEKITGLLLNSGLLHDFPNPVEGIL